MILLRSARSCALLYALVAIWFVVPTVTAHPTVEYRTYVTQILSSDGGGGSAYSTKEGTVVTAAHVVVGGMFFRAWASGAYVSLELVCLDTMRDFALLRGPIKVSVSPLDSEPVQVGDPVTIAGYLGATDYIEIHAHVLRYLASMPIRDEETGAARQIGPAFLVYHGRGRLSGLSGSPVMSDRTKKVVGTAVGYNDVFGTAVFVPALGVTGTCRFP